eukprot:TRINITY_DN75725_c0_g1_i1.p1 TRINITY_DN75725_c0_g1~~TRINITY_DN75725_c0_g1_i1.p1  ORF type:complete len:370 (+),score=34.50 TRINITY_DN75725_c0_g1_i1:61-1170(+)
MAPRARFQMRLKARVPCVAFHVLWLVSLSIRLDSNESYREDCSLDRGLFTHQSTEFSLAKIGIPIPTTLAGTVNYIYKKRFPCQFSVTKHQFDTFFGISTKDLSGIDFEDDWKVSMDEFEELVEPIWKRYQTDKEGMNDFVSFLHDKAKAHIESVQSKFGTTKAFFDTLQGVLDHFFPRQNSISKNHFDTLLSISTKDLSGIAFGGDNQVSKDEFKEFVAPIWDQYQIDQEGMNDFVSFLFEKAPARVASIQRISDADVALPNTLLEISSYLYHKHFPDQFSIRKNQFDTFFGIRTKMFSAFDLDGDCKVSVEEFEEFVAPIWGQYQTNNEGMNNFESFLFAKAPARAEFVQEEAARALNDTQGMAESS